MSTFGLTVLAFLVAVGVSQLIRLPLARSALRRWAEAHSIALHEAQSDSWGYARFPSGSARSRPCFRIRVTMADGTVRTGHALAGRGGILLQDDPAIDLRWDADAGAA